MQITKEKITCTLFAGFLAVMLALFIFLPRPQYFMDERRSPAKLPTFSSETILSGRFMNGFESFAVDAVPFRTDFRRLKAVSALYLFRRQDNHGIYVKDGFAAKMEYPLKEASLLRATDRFRYVFDTYLKEDNRVFWSMIPDKNYFLARDSGHLRMDYQKMEEIMKGKMDFAEYIPIFDQLEIKDYYQTDTHWRQEKIVDVAERIAGAMGVKMPRQYQSRVGTSQFHGVYYGQSALPLSAEELIYLTNDVLQAAKGYDFENNRPISIYDEALAVGKDGYEMFLSGPLSLIRLENPQASKDRKLILFRDSFGSALAPLLLEGYSEIWLVDIRYLAPAQLGKYIDFANSDVLFLYSTLVLNNSQTIK